MHALAKWIVLGAFAGFVVGRAMRGRGIGSTGQLFSVLDIMFGIAGAYVGLHFVGHMGLDSQGGRAYSYAVPLGSGAISALLLRLLVNGLKRPRISPSDEDNVYRRRATGSDL